MLENFKRIHTKNLIKIITRYETAALAGIVMIQAQTILLPIPHLTAEIRLTAPAPMMAPEIACVVLAGIPKCAKAAKIVAPLVSAANP